jgi:hypothetical protein
MASSNNTSDIDTKFQEIYRYFIDKYPQDTFEIQYLHDPQDPYEIQETYKFKCCAITQSISERDFIGLDGDIKPKLPIKGDCSVYYVLLNKKTNKKLCYVKLTYYYIPDSKKEILNVYALINYTSKKETEYNSNNTKGQIYQKGLGRLFLLIAINKFLEEIYKYILDDSPNGFRKKNEEVIDTFMDSEDKSMLARRISDTFAYYRKKNNNFNDIEIRLYPSALAFNGVKSKSPQESPPPQESPQESLVRYYKSIGFSDKYNGKTLNSNTLGTQYNILINNLWTFLRQLPQTGGFIKVKSKKIKNSKKNLKKNKILVFLKKQPKKTSILRK